MAKSPFRGIAAVSTLLSGVLAGPPTGQAFPPPPPPPPEVFAQIQADCRTPPRERINLVKSVVPLPEAPAELHLGWAIRLDPPPGAHIGRVIGITRAWSGSIIAATDRGYWIRVPAKKDESRTVPPGPVAISIRDLPAPPDHMGVGIRPPEPGGSGTEVMLSVPGQPSLLSYEIGWCFPGARPESGPSLPAGERVFRFEPSTDARSNVLLQGSDKSIRYADMDGSTPLKPGAPAPEIVSSASLSARIDLARGCDEVTLHHDRGGTLIRTSCSPGYLSLLDSSWASPSRQHRQPLPITGIRLVGRIRAPIVAVSDAQRVIGPSPDSVRRGDRSDPETPCFFLLAAQTEADAPVFIYGAQPYCAYYPSDPSGTPVGPAPPP